MTLESLREECKALVDRISDEASLRTLRDLLLLPPEEHQEFITWFHELERSSPLHETSISDAALFLNQRIR